MACINRMCEALRHLCMGGRGEGGSSSFTPSVVFASPFHPFPPLLRFHLSDFFHLLSVLSLYLHLLFPFPSTLLTTFNSFIFLLSIFLLLLLFPIQLILLTFPSPLPIHLFRRIPETQETAFTHAPKITPDNPSPFPSHPRHLPLSPFPLALPLFPPP